MVWTPAKSFLAAGLLLSVATPVFGQAPVLRSQNHDYRVVTVAEGLMNPWSVAFLPEGDILITEKSGIILVLILQSTILALLEFYQLL